MGKKFLYNEVHCAVSAIMRRNLSLVIGSLTHGSLGTYSETQQYRYVADDSVVLSPQIDINITLACADSKARFETEVVQLKVVWSISPKVAKHENPSWRLTNESEIFITEAEIDRADSLVELALQGIHPVTLLNGIPPQLRQANPARQTVHNKG
jgi:hypothetical protein